MGSVVNLVIPPKQDRFRHRTIEYTLTYDPEFKMWRWEFVIVSRMNIGGVSDDYESAKRAAKVHIDLAQGE